jgi:hypothetical protein
LLTKLELHYTTYGCPALMKDRTWQDKHIESWRRTCARVSKTLINLHTLKIYIKLHHDPLRFNLRQPWVAPLLQFRRLTQRNTKLQTIGIDFKTRLSSNHFFGNHPLVKASEDLHQKFGSAISKAIRGVKEEEAMKEFKEAWEGEHAMWQYHLGFGKTGW